MISKRAPMEVRAVILKRFGCSLKKALKGFHCGHRGNKKKTHTKIKTPEK